jgi:hypothetical protein
MHPHHTTSWKQPHYDYMEATTTFGTWNQPSSRRNRITYSQSRASAVEESWLNYSPQSRCTANNQDMRGHAQPICSPWNRDSLASREPNQPNKARDAQTSHLVSCFGPETLAENQLSDHDRVDRETSGTGRLLRSRKHHILRWCITLWPWPSRGLVIRQMTGYLSEGRGL